MNIGSLTQLANACMKPWGMIAALQPTGLVSVHQKLMTRDEDELIDTFTELEFCQWMIDSFGEDMSTEVLKEFNDSIASHLDGLTSEDA